MFLEYSILTIAIKKVFVHRKYCFTAIFSVHRAPIQTPLMLYQIYALCGMLLIYRADI